MVRTSAGILLYRLRDHGLEVFLIHMGGPFWANKDHHAWSIPKGEFTEEEAPLAAARREFQEETGITLSGDFIPLTPIKQAGGKIVHAWAMQGDCDTSACKSNDFKMEWPPMSGQYKSFPEADRFEWFDLETAKKKIIKGQIPFLEELQAVIIR